MLLLFIWFVLHLRGFSPGPVIDQVQVSHSQFLSGLTQGLINCLTNKITRYVETKTTLSICSSLASSLHLVDIFHGVKPLLVPAVSARPGLDQPPAPGQDLGGETAELIVPQRTVGVAVTEGVVGQSRLTSLAQE